MNLAMQLAFMFMAGVSYSQTAFAVLVWPLIASKLLAVQVSAQGALYLAEHVAHATIVGHCPHE